MKIAFHINQLDMRGTGVAVYDYARICETMLGHDAVIVAPTIKAQPRFQSDEAARHFENRFEVHRYDRFDDVDPILRELGVDVFYALKSGKRDQIVSKYCKTAVHAVFQQHEPHGDVYAYFSQWLAEKMGQGLHPWVAPMIDLPDFSGDMRDELGISEDSIVFGRYGGCRSFDITFVQQVVFELAKRRPDLTFLFMNTNRFCEELRNIIHLDGTSDTRRKVEFINTCDAMLHARQMGESFGLAIAEFSTRNRPVITHAGGYDQAHLKMLGTKGIYYRSSEQLTTLLEQFEPDPMGDWDAYSHLFSASNVMARFSRVFLEGGAYRKKRHAGAQLYKAWTANITALVNSASSLTSVPKKLQDRRRRRRGRPARRLALPIGFGIPAELFVEDPGATDKIRPSAIITPYDRATYIYPPTLEGEAAYHAQYRESYFGVTCKKGGWDCMRHYEILSQGCMPWFADIHNCPDNLLVDMPKSLLKQVHDLPGCRFDAAKGQVVVDQDRFDNDRYWRLLHQLFDFARKHLTTKQIALRMLQRAAATQCRTILALSVSPGYIDYLGGMLLHGLREIPGIVVTDAPRMDYMYNRKDNPLDHSEPGMWGFGYSLAHRLPEPDGIDRTDIPARILSGEFDLVVYLDAGKRREDGLPYWDLVRQSIDRQRLLLINGNDGPGLILDPFRSGGIVFQRERRV